MSKVRAVRDADRRRAAQRARALQRIVSAIVDLAAGGRPVAYEEVMPTAAVLYGAAEARKDLDLLKRLIDAVQPAPDVPQENH